MKTWRFFAIFWSILCFIFAGIILCQSGRTVDERIADAGFTILPLVFFAFGMSMRRRLLKERAGADTLTTATVVSEGMKIRTGHKRSFHPEYEFRVNEKTCKVRSQGGSGICVVSKGKQVDLYYNSKNPNVFYVPIMQRHERRLSAFYCGIGIALPLIGLFAPQLRALFSFLP